MPDEPPPSDRDVIVSALLVIANAPHAGRTDSERVAAAYARSPGAANPTPVPSRQAAHVLADAIFRVGVFGPPPAPPHDPLLDASHFELGLPLRAVNVLDAAGIVTVRQLVAQTPYSLMSIRNLGQHTLKEIVEKLAAKGLRLTTVTE